MMNKDDKVVVLGATGYMGSWLIQDLFDAGYTNVYGTFNNPEKAQALQSDFAKLHLVQIDVLNDNAKLIELMKDTRWLFNDTAAFSGQEKTTDDYILTKTIMVNNVMQAVKQAGTVRKIVHIGSVGTIGAGHYDPSVLEYDESDVSAMDPDNIWGIMKVAEEKTVTRWCKALDIDYVIVHPTNVIGPSKLAWNHDMIVAYLKNGQPLIDSQMDSIDVRDVAQMQLDLMNNDQAKNIRILGTGFTLMFSDLVDDVNEHLDQKQIETLFGQMSAVISQKDALAVLKNVPDSKYYQENINRINNTLNIHTKYPEMYKYQFTNAKETIFAALDKMLENK